MESTLEGHLPYVFSDLEEVTTDKRVKRPQPMRIPENIAVVTGLPSVFLLLSVILRS